MLVNPGSKVHMPVLQATASGSSAASLPLAWAKTNASKVLLHCHICVLARTSSYIYCSLQLAESTDTLAAVCEHPKIYCQLHPALKIAI